MAERPVHLMTRYRDVLTPRQQEILAMIANGKTNYEIARSLGISLDGAKWHVREILTKLNVDSREDAVAEWRLQRSPGSRVRALVRALLPAKLLMPVAAGAATVAVAAGVITAVFLIQRGNDDQPPASVLPTVEATATAGAGALNEALPGDGSEGYAYNPELAYVDPDGVVWLVAADGSDRRQLLEGCTGVGSPKSGTLTGGLRWSPSGDWIACWKEDLSVRAAAIDGSASGQPFAPGECIGPFTGPQFPPGAPGVACETNAGLQVREVESGEVRSTFPTTQFGAHHWLSDGSLITAGPVEANHGTWKVFAPDGSEVAHIKGAYVGVARGFAWTAEERKLAFPGERGLTVLDLATGESHTLENPAFDDVNWGDGADIAFALDGAALVVQVAPFSVLVDASTGATISAGPAPSWGRISPDGRYRAHTVDDGSNKFSTALTDLKDGTTRNVAGSPYMPGGIGIGPHFAWSGDSKRFCWTLEANAPTSPRYCASVDNLTAVAVDTPFQFRSEELGYGDLDIMWEPFSPDLELVIASPSPTVVGLAVVALGGSGKVTVLGQALSEYAFAWRPDGVARP